VFAATNGNFTILSIANLIFMQAFFKFVGFFVNIWSRKMKMFGIKINKKSITVLVAAVAVAIGILRYAAIQGVSGDSILRGAAGGSAAGVQTEKEGSADPAQANSAPAETSGGPSGSLDAPAKESAPPQMVFIDIGGAVADPGVIAMPAGSRISDAIEAAGGLTEEAETKEINRATKLADGDKIYIPTKDEVRQGNFPQGAGSGGGTAGTASASNTAGAASANGGAAGLVNINTANQAALETLPGVGPAIAQRILDFRTRNGAFPTIEALMNVSGIGSKTFEKLRDKITV